MLVIVQDLIQKYYEMGNVEHIKDFHHSVFIENDSLKLILKHRVLKHIVEQRKRDGYSGSEIKSLFIDVYYLMSSGKYSVIPNKKEQNSFLFIEIIQEKTKGTVLVLEAIFQEDRTYIIKTGFYRASSKIRKLLR